MKDQNINHQLQTDRLKRYSAQQIPMKRKSVHEKKMSLALQKRSNLTLVLTCHQKHKGHNVDVCVRLAKYLMNDLRDFTETFRNESMDGALKLIHF